MSSYREKLQKKFTEEYQKLNEQQRRAVDTIEGPVMVIAGPGTGKTQILAARIGKILLDTDTLPQQILCLTYTDAGALAMRRRLLQFIGPDAYKVTISTFHAFCNDVIQENLSLFEKNELHPVSDLERIEVYKTLIDNFPKDHVLKRFRGDVYYEIKNLQELFSNIKREGWQPEFIIQKIDEYLEGMANDVTYRYKNSRKGEYEKGDLKPKYGEKVKAMEKLRAAVNEFPKFQALMRQRELYDFDDMINWVIRVFKEHKNVLADYQERFQYILVDEYQDTSGSQNEIVKLLIGFWESPNVFVVGDDDQSIFRFQGANVENMENFARSYSDLLMVVLVNNYRSTAPILRLSHSVIGNNLDRLIHKFEGLNKDLVCSREELLELDHNPLIVEYNTTKDEMADITNKVKCLVDNGTQPGDIAIISKENSYNEQLMTYFRLKGIPVYSKRSINILCDPFAKKILQWMRYLAAEHDTPYGGDELLFEIMHFDFYKIPPIEIAKLTVEVNNRRYNKEATSLRRLLYERSKDVKKDLFDTGLPTEMKNFSRTLEGLVAAVSNTTIQQLFEKIIAEAGILSYIMQHENKIKLLQILTALFDFIKQTTARDPFLTLQQLVSLIESMQDEKIPLPLVQVSGSEKGVNLLTAHGSKGLEFEHVFVTGVNAHTWESKKKPRKPFTMPENLFTSLPATDDVEETRRLFYVALTRAEKHLQVSYIKMKGDGKEAEASRFIAEIVDATGIEIQPVVLPDDELMEYEILNYQNQAPEIAKSEKDFITPLIEKYVMNVTSLNSYLDCPIGFYYKNIIRIPAGKSENLEFGSAVHFALQKLFEDMQKDPQQQFPPKDTVYNYFSWYMNHHRENFTAEAFKRRMEYGEKILGDYYDHYTERCNKVVAIEKNIRNVVVNGVPLKGKIDKMEFDGKEVNVVDYKTGNVSSPYTTEKLKAPYEKLPLGGDYWRQAVFYKILVDNMEGKDWKVISAEFDFVEPDKNKGYQKKKLFITPADIETVKQQLTMVWNKIQEHDFYTGCGKEECHWCNFVKDNGMAVTLHEMMEAEEEEAL